MKKSQSSMEFLIILGIAFTFIILLGGIFISYSNSSQKNLNSDQIEKIGDELIAEIEKIYFRGSGNKIQYKANFPNDITNMTLHHRINGANNFTYLNITQIGDGQEVSHIFLPEENYIKFVCLNCSNPTPTDFSNEFTQQFRREDYSAGSKTIAISSQNNRVELEVIR